MISSVLPVFSSKSFIFPGLTFRYLIHFEFLFVYGVKKCSTFILLHVAVQFSHHCLLEEVVFALLYILASCLVPLVYISVCEAQMFMLQE